MSTSIKDVVLKSILLGIIFLISLQFLQSMELSTILESLFSLLICFIFVSIISRTAYKYGSLEGIIIGYLISCTTRDRIIFDLMEYNRDKNLELSKELKDSSDYDQIWKIAYSYGCIDTLGIIASDLDKIDQDFFSSYNSE